MLGTAGYVDRRLACRGDCAVSADSRAIAAPCDATGWALPALRALSAERALSAPWTLSADRRCTSAAVAGIDAVPSARGSVASTGTRPTLARRGVVRGVAGGSGLHASAARW